MRLIPDSSAYVYQRTHLRALAGIERACARDSDRIYRANDLYANLVWKANPKLR